MKRDYVDNKQLIMKRVLTVGIFLTCLAISLIIFFCNRNTQKFKEIGKERNYEASIKNYCTTVDEISDCKFKQVCGSTHTYTQKTKGTSTGPCPKCGFASASKTSLEITFSCDRNIGISSLEYTISVEKTICNKCSGSVAFLALPSSRDSRQALTLNTTTTYTYNNKNYNSIDSIIKESHYVCLGHQYIITLDRKGATSGASEIYLIPGTGIYKDSRYMLEMTTSSNPITPPTRQHTVTYNHNYSGSSNTSATSIYTFGGYYTSSTGGIRRITADGYLSTGFTSTTYSEDTTLYAHWTSESVPAYIPTRVGYVFGGWYNEAACTTQVIAPGSTYTPTNDITLYAKWTVNQLTITLNGNGATSSGTTAIYVVPGIGIYKDSAHTQEMTESANAITIPTRKPTVTFNYNGNGQSNTTETATYIFKGYFTSTSGGTQRITNGGYINSSYFSNSTYSSDVTLYAQWTENSIMVPSAPSREGYTFDGWYSSQAGGSQVISKTASSYVPTEDITVYAKWTANQYTVTLEGNGATSNGTTAIYTIYGTGIYKDSSRTQLMTRTSNPITKPTRQYTVTFNYNGNGQSNTSKIASYRFDGYQAGLNYGGMDMIDEYGYITTNFNVSTITSNASFQAQWLSSSISLPSVPTRDGYTFEGWYSSEVGGTEVISKTATTYTPTETRTVYAKWTANKYTVTLDGNGATSNGTTAIYTTYGIGIYLDSARTKEMTESANPITKPTKEYTITYNYNGNGQSNTTATATYTFVGYSYAQEGRSNGN